MAGGKAVFWSLANTVSTSVLLTVVVNDGTDSFVVTSPVDADVASIGVAVIMAPVIRLRPILKA